MITLTGPRQSGKTTLSKTAFPDFAYVNLEPRETRQFAQEDPRGFLDRYSHGAIFDEVQSVPELMPYVQERVDASGRNDLQYVLTGSHNFLLMQTVGQSLAGRSIQVELLPFSKDELQAAGKLPQSPWEYVWRGSYPRLYDGAEVSEWLPSYIQNYVERDVRLLTQVGDLGKFQTFLMLCAGRIGQLLNLTSLGNDVGVDHKTIARWISVLEASYLVFLLRPHHENFHKRLVKSPKLYFWDTGLACSLLRIRTPQDIESHYLRGGLFENLAIVEAHKRSLNRGERPQYWFWRDFAGLEVDLLSEDGQNGFSVAEIKSSQTIGSEMFAGLEKFNALTGKKRVSQMRLMHAGEGSHVRKGVEVVGWKDW